MSLLEDIFLQDEANEAQQLERVIEGDEFEEKLRSDSDENSEKEDEAEEDKRRVDPAATKTKRVVRNPRFILNPARLSGPRGIQVIPEHFKDFKFKGKGHEKEDLDLVLKKLEHWAYRLYPKFQFSDCLKKIEMLGKKRPVMVHLHKIRSDQYVSEETVVQRDSSDDEQTPAAAVPQEDEFDRLLQQQIELARNTPAPSSVRKPEKSLENGIFYNPKATSSPSISEDQRERMLRSRRLAEEKRLARLKNTNTNNIANKDVTVDTTNLDENESNKYSNIVKEVEDGGRNKKNRSNIIDSSDEEDITIVETVTIDIHDSKNIPNKTSVETIHDKVVENNDIDADEKISLDIILKNLNNDIVFDKINDSNSMECNEFSENSNKLNDEVNFDKGANKSNNDNEENNDVISSPDLGSGKISDDNDSDKSNSTSCNTETNKCVENDDNTNHCDINNAGIVLCDSNAENAANENISTFNMKYKEANHNNENTDNLANVNKILSNIDANVITNAVSIADTLFNKDFNSISNDEIVQNDNSKKEVSIAKSVNFEMENSDKTVVEENETNLEDELMDVDFSDDF